MFNFGILGINARNLLYVKKFNSDKAINLADDKLKTKQYLHHRGIPVSKLYAVIHNRTELKEFDFLTLPEDFVIKPNTGSKGRGILIVHLDKSKYSEIDPQEEVYFDRFNRGDKIFKVNGKYMSEYDLKKYMIDILDGQYSMGIGSDKIIIEEKLIPSKIYSKYCKHGLADIRVITFNLIPVAAMVRVPTSISGGKANLAQGGIGFGIDVGTGKIKNMYFRGKIYKHSFPGEYKEFFGKKISYWDDILNFSSQIQYFVNLGYMALDWVVTQDGPKILELNARAGLSIQNASNLHLERRLQKLGDIKLSSPSKGVQIAKSLFTDEEKSLLNLNKVLYLSQRGKIIDKDNNELAEVEVQVNLSKENNYISNELYQKIRGKKINLDLYENEILIKNLSLKSSKSVYGNKIVLGTNDLHDFYIKPVHNKQLNLFGTVNPQNILENEIENLKHFDDMIYQISRIYNILGKTKPINHLDELDKFITMKGNYNPRFDFRYSNLDMQEILDRKTQLQEMKQDFSFKSKFAQLFLGKIDEMLLNLDLVQGYKSQDFEKIYENNVRLYGDFDENLIKQAKDIVYAPSQNDKNALGRLMSFAQVKVFVRDYLRKKGFEHISIVIDNTGVGRLSIIRGDVIKVRISNMVRFREKALLSTLAHEVDVHLTRAVNGDNSGWKILKTGTGFYLKDEEGLAVYKGFEKLPQGYMRKGIYEEYYFVSQAHKYDFKQLAELFRDEFGYNYIKSFNYALRLKRGISDTSIIDKGAVFIKNKIYLDGYLDIQKYVQNGGNIDSLMIGKIKKEDVDYIL